MIKIDVFVLSGCARCTSGLDSLKEVAESFGQDVFVWQERNLLEHIDFAVELGILSTPAIAVDGKLAFVFLPSPKQLQAELTKHVAT
jgi:thioredoxin 1